MDTMRIIENSAIDKIFVLHECLIVDYDNSFVEEYDDKRYCLSDHLLWIGYRTVQIYHVHPKFLNTIENLVCIKVGLATSIKNFLESIKF